VIPLISFLRLICVPLEFIISLSLVLTTALPSEFELKSGPAFYSSLGSFIAVAIGPLK
jgi:hypothetical protein